MGRHAPRVYTSDAEVDRLRALQLALDPDIEMELRMSDGSLLKGTILDRPTIQQFLGPDDAEGTNGQVTVDVLGEGKRILWLDEIQEYLVTGAG